MKNYTSWYAYQNPLTGINLGYIAPKGGVTPQFNHPNWYWPISLSISIIRYLEIYFWWFLKPILQALRQTNMIYKSMCNKPIWYIGLLHSTISVYSIITLIFILHCRLYHLARSLSPAGLRCIQGVVYFQSLLQ